MNIRSDLKIFCNLAGSDNSFHGQSNGVSLFAGMYDEIAENIYAEPMRSDLPKREYIREAQAILIDIFNRLKRPEPESVILFSDKKFFQVPENFGLNSNTDNTVVMSDHITSISCSNGPELAGYIMESLIKPKSDSLCMSRYRDYLKYLFNRQDQSDPLFQSAVDLNLLLKEIDEWRSLAVKYPGMNREEYEHMNEQEREAHDTDERRMFDLNQIINEKAAKYLFYESPRKEENMRIFFDYFTLESQEDYLGLVERIVRGELEHGHSKNSEQAL